MTSPCLSSAGYLLGNHDIIFVDLVLVGLDFNFLHPDFANGFIGIILYFLSFAGNSVLLL